MHILKQMAIGTLFILPACTTSSEVIAVHQWSREEQIKIAREHNALPADSILRPVLDEWQALRAAAK